MLKTYYAGFFASYESKYSMCCGRLLPCLSPAQFRNKKSEAVVLYETNDRASDCAKKPEPSARLVYTLNPTYEMDLFKLNTFSRLVYYEAGYLKSSDDHSCYFVILSKRFPFDIGRILKDMLSLFL